MGLGLGLGSDPNSSSAVAVALAVAVAVALALALPLTCVTSMVPSGDTTAARTAENPAASLQRVCAARVSGRGEGPKARLEGDAFWPAAVVEHKEP